jgi:hypothetical protein
MLSNKDKEAVTCFYSAGSVERWERNPRGLVNINYELDERFFLTIFRKRTSEQLDAIAKMTHLVPKPIPLARPVAGESGYVLKLPTGSALLTPRLRGEHYLGHSHADKHPITLELHRFLACFFWDFQAALSETPHELKGQLPSSWKTDIPLHYPDAVHGDFERQNLLCSQDKVTGVVDLDAFRQGDVLYEFSHFLFNFVFCDPEYTPSKVAVYFNELVKAGKIDDEHLRLVQTYMTDFSVKDLSGFVELSGSHEIDLAAILGHYTKALHLASNFFRSEFP